MVRDYWEFLSEENKARVIFGAILVAVVLIVAIPYFVTVLNNRQPEETAKVEEYTEIETEEAKTEETQVEAEDSVAEEAVTEETHAGANTNAAATYAAPAANSSSTASNQPAPQADPTPTRTTVDDRSAGDDGYTPSGIDDPGADEEMGTDGVDNSEN